MWHHRLVLVLLLVFSLACSGSFRPGGVLLPNQMDSNSRPYVAEKRLLEPGEEILAFYDAAIILDGSERFILTDQRVITHFQGSTRSMKWSEVAIPSSTSGEAPIPSPPPTA